MRKNRFSVYVETMINGKVVVCHGAIPIAKFDDCVTAADWAFAIGFRARIYYNSSEEIPKKPAHQLIKYRPRTRLKNR